MSVEGKGRSVKRKKKKKKGGNALIFRPSLPVKRDTLQPVERGEKKEIGKKIDDNDDK